MYVLRSALRASTRRPPARFIRGRRYPSPVRFRPFHTHHPLAQASNPPQNPDSTPIGENDTGKADREKAAAGDSADATVATDDPEILAQKLQRSRETSRRYSAALRRQQRAKKSQGLPPVHIPDWFLKGRVIRLEDLPDEVRKQARSAAFAISVSHAESGEEAACAIPAPREEDGARELSRLVRGLWGKRLDDHELRKVEKFRDERKASSQSGVETKQKSNSGRKDGTKIERRHKERGTERSPRARMPPLVLAEIKATIAASLSTLAPAGGDSFPSAKTNLLLHAPAADQEKMVDTCVHGIAAELGSEIVVIEAQDLAQLAGDYLGEGPEPSPRSVRSLGYETYRLSTELNESVENYLEATGEELEFPQPPPMHPDESDPMNNMRGFGNFVFDLRPVMETLKQRLRSSQVPGGGAFEIATSAMNNDVGRSQSQNELHLEDLKITALLEALLDASDLKQTRGLKGVNEAASPLVQKDRATDVSKAPAFFDYSVDSDDQGLELNSALPANVGSGIELNVNFGVSPPNPRSYAKSKIIYVKDYKEMYATHYGGRIIQKLEEVVRKRRISGESIMIVGSTCSRELTPELTSRGVRDLQGSGETTFSRTIVVGTESRSTQTPLHELFAAMQHDVGTTDALPAEKSKFQRINLSHIREMLRYLDPTAATSITNMDQRSRTSRPWLSIFPDSYLKRVLTYDEVHRIALTALGLYNTDPARSASAPQGKPSQLNWAHVALAIGLLRASDTIKYAAFDRMAKLASTQKRSQITIEENERRPEDRIIDEQSLQRQRHLQTIAASATKHEKRLLPGIADPHQIKTTFDQVHVSQDTVDSIRTITSLSLLRPDAFNYGILATEKISGALLYGPPGTGKTLLAKAVAKESGSTVLEVSGSQIMDKYVGEGEKNVAAVFSLARKLSPCIVFLDEADAIFASRDSMSERTSHRDILNQFLKEWDGLNNLSVFVMVATNRPFDLDDAVIRRLPRRLLVDLPTQADRKEILSIHLRGEQLDPSVDLEDIAKRTPFYSGSDLKNIAISAALACVKEENEQAAIAAARATLETDPEPHPDSSNATTDSETTPEAASPTSTSSSTSKPKAPHLVRGQVYDFPDRRTLHARHFDQALQEISASISEDMSSLNAIKKFDEQYGDRKGKKRRKDFGFGALAERNESEARVRK